MYYSGDGLPRFEDRIVAAERRIPAWVDPATPRRPWIDAQAVLPWLRQRPYLVGGNRAGELRKGLQSADFAVVEASLQDGEKDPERAFLQELTYRLGFDELGAGSWGAFNDRLWDFLTSDESTPFAVMIVGMDALAKSDIYHFLRCVHNLLSLTEGAGLSNSAANRQIEYFFIGEW